jgi:AraC-like DNA-binding protein
MHYGQTKPDGVLTGYIDAFWTASGDGRNLLSEKILPDGCVDIILNFGDNCKTDDGNCTIKTEKAYLVGPMKRFKTVQMSPETNLIGIRFKPGAFSSFYKFASLHEVTDVTIELEKDLSPNLKSTDQNVTRNLNRFFEGRLTPPKHTLFPIISDIQICKGNISVSDLASRHFITTKQLERNFRHYIGMSPKEFINLTRFRFVLPAIQDKTCEKSLSAIAFEHGFYDHAHLSKEVRRYTGAVPSQL